MTVTERESRRLSARDPRLAPWRAFLLAHARVVRRLDEELRAEHDLSLAEYDALLTIAQAPDGRVRMGSLADQVLLSKSGVTRLIDRLVGDGLVERTTCSADASESVVREPTTVLCIRIQSHVTNRSADPGRTRTGVRTNATARMVQARTSCSCDSRRTGIVSGGHRDRR